MSLSEDLLDDVANELSERFSGASWLVAIGRADATRTVIVYAKIRPPKAAREFISDVGATLRIIGAVRPALKASERR